MFRIPRIANLGNFRPLWYDRMRDPFWSNSHFLSCTSNNKGCLLQMPPPLILLHSSVYLAILCTFHFSRKSEKNIQFFAKNAKKYIIRKYSLKFSTFKKSTIAGYIRKSFHVNICLYKFILMLIFFLIFENPNFNFWKL